MPGQHVAEPLAIASSISLVADEAVVTRVTRADEPAESPAANTDVVNPQTPDAPAVQLRIAPSTQTPRQEEEAAAATEEALVIEPSVERDAVEPRDNPHPEEFVRIEAAASGETELTEAPAVDEPPLEITTALGIVTPDLEVEEISGLALPVADDAIAVHIGEIVEPDPAIDEPLSLVTTEIDMNSLEFLILGGAHGVSDFGSTLLSELNQFGGASRIAAAGSSTQTWLSDTSAFTDDDFIQDSYSANQGLLTSIRLDTVMPTRGLLQSFIDLSQPNVVVIQLMDSQLFNSAENNQESVRDLIQFMKTYETDEEQPRVCFYVSTTHTTDESTHPTMTNSAKQDFITNVLTPVLEEEGCTLIDSMELLSENQVQTTDGLHLTTESASLWGQEVASNIIENLTNTYGSTELITALEPDEDVIATDTHDCYAPDNEEAIIEIYGASFTNSIQPLLKDAYLENDLDPRLVYHRMIGESRGDPNIYNSSSGAYGIFQFLGAYLGQDDHEVRIRRLYEEASATTDEEKSFI